MNTINNTKTRSSICDQLITMTKKNELDWLPYSALLDYLSDESIDPQNVFFLKSYSHNLRQSRIIADKQFTYFTILRDRVFSLTKSSYSKTYKLFFCSLNYPQSSWRRVAVRQEELLLLSNYIQLIGIDKSNAFCQDLLYSTACYS